MEAKQWPFRDRTRQRVVIGVVESLVALAGRQSESLCGAYDEDAAAGVFGCGSLASAPVSTPACARSSATTTSSGPCWPGPRCA